MKRLSGIFAVLSLGLLLGTYPNWALKWWGTNVYTGLLLLVLLCSLLAALGFVLAVQLGAPRRVYMMVIALSMSLLMGLMGAELTLRFGYKAYRGYEERSGRQEYHYMFQVREYNWYHTRLPHHVWLEDRPEFQHAIACNNEGVRDENFDTLKPQGQFRILTLGDSFTEGIGAPLPSQNWPGQMDIALARMGYDSIRVLNAGVAGCDPWFSYILLKNRLLKYRPDVVVLAINGSDLEDIALRGGNGRFRPNGKVTYRLAPSWEWLYGCSYLLRYILHGLLGYDYWLQSLAQQTENLNFARRELQTSIDSLASLGRQHGFRVLVAAHPLARQFAPDVPFSFGLFCQKLELHPGCDTLNLKPALAKALGPRKENACWPIDGHYTPETYALMGKFIAQKLQQNDIHANGTSKWLPQALETKPTKH